VEQTDSPQVLLQTHLELLVHWLAGLGDIEQLAKSMPWSVVLAQAPSLWATKFLDNLKVEWSLVQAVAPNLVQCEHSPCD
jgi:hypothetical protein